MKRTDKAKVAKFAVLGQLMSAALLLVVLGLLLVFSSSINTQVQATQTSGSTAYNVSTNVNAGLNTFSTWIPTIALVVVAVVIIYLLVSGFSGIIGNKGGGGM